MAYRHLPDRGDALMRGRLRSEDGFTLPELLTAITIALIVSLAAFALIEFTLKKTGEVDQRVDATQRGRAIMDTITRQLRSQVCLSPTISAMATRPGDITDGNTATFYADFTDGADTTTKPAADLHRLAYDPTTKKMTDATYTTSWDKTTTPWTPVVPAAPSKTRVIATDIVPKDATTPIFAYYAYTNDPTPAPTLSLSTAGAGGMSVADLMRVARIDVTFTALPNKGKDTSPAKVLFQDEVYVRAADPNDDAPTPTCA
jgi:prepilin-type N-terminal cleavage/methylation domain-containing protein